MTESDISLHVTINLQGNRLVVQRTGDPLAAVSIVNGKFGSVATEQEMLLWQVSPFTLHVVAFCFLSRKS